MSTNNPVFNLLATSGNQALLAAGNKPDALGVGQAGVFNFHTGLSIDGNTPTANEDIFIAVGLDRDGDGVVDDISTSAGQMIQSRLVKSVMVKPYVDEVSKVVDLYGFNAKADTTYVVNIELRDQRSYLTNGYQPFTKPFSVQTSPSADGVSTVGDPVELAKGIADGVNADPDKLLVATLLVNRSGGTISSGASASANITVGIGSESFSVPVASGDTAAVVAGKIAAFVNAITTSGYTLTNTGAAILVYSKLSIPTVAPITIANANGTGVAIGTPVSADVAITDTVAFKQANPGISPIVRFTAQKEVRTGGTGINVKYHKTGLDFLVIPKAGFEQFGKASTKVDLQYLQGAGYDLLQEEYVAQGWGKAGPYRTNAVTGLANSVQQFVSPSGKYTKFSLTHDLLSVGGWEEYRNNLETLIAVPCADSTTITALATIFALLFTKFATMVDDVNGINCTNAQPVNKINNPALDGIETLA